MTLYHGGLIAVPRPTIVKSERVGDFGLGFYTTTDFEQARRFVRRKCAIAGVDCGVISEYSIPDNALECKNLAVRRFDDTTNDWIEFVFSNRKIALYEHGFDLVFGPVANDQVYSSLALFEDGQIGHDELIRRLRSRKLVDQLLFHTERSLELLTFVRRTEIVCSEK